VNWVQAWKISEDGRTSSMIKDWAIEQTDYVKYISVIKKTEERLNPP
jgi:hypothetical protein